MKTLILADSSCDLPVEVEKSLPNFRIIDLNIAVDGENFKDRTEFTAKDVYAYVERTGKIPFTSQATIPEYMGEFQRAIEEGYTHIICTCINSEGSSTYYSAQQARSFLLEENPELGKVTFYFVDSHTYSLGHGLPLPKAVEMLERGEEPEVVANYLQTTYDSLITVVGLNALSYAKRSGRLNSAAAFVGEVLGLKPIMTINGENKVVEKARGEKALLSRMTNYYTTNTIGLDTDYAIAYGDDIAIAHALEEQLMAKGAKPATAIYPIGATIACNAGNQMVGIAFTTKQ